MAKRRKPTNGERVKRRRAALARRRRDRGDAEYQKRTGIEVVRG